MASGHWTLALVGLASLHWTKMVVYYSLLMFCGGLKPEPSTLQSYQSLNLLVAARIREDIIQVMFPVKSMKKQSGPPELDQGPTATDQLHKHVIPDYKVGPCIISPS